MENIEKFEVLVNDIEGHIPTIEYIKERTGINVTSIKKYFPKAYRAKKVIISGIYIIFTESKDKYIGSSRDILGRINQYMGETKDILVVYVYEVCHLDAKYLKIWLKHELAHYDNVLFWSTLKNRIIPTKIEDTVPKNVNIEDIIPEDINIVRCIDNVPIKEIEKIPHAPGVYVLQFADGEYYVGSSGNMYYRLKQHKSHLSNFIIGISICETQNTLDALILEPIFMKILKPKYNRVLRFDNHNKSQGINILRKGRDRLKNRSFRRINTKYVPISEDVLRLLNEKRSELYEQGIFSWSIQTLAEVAIKEGLNTVCNNIYHILEMEEVEKYIDSQRYDC